MTKPKVRIIACADNFHFIKDLIPALSDEFDIETLPLVERKGQDWWWDLTSSDLLWLEWADEASLRFLDICRQSRSLINVKVILRLHRYELFTQRTIDAIAKLSQKNATFTAWTTANLAEVSQTMAERIDKLVFVSKMVQNIGTEKFPWMADSVVIPNLIDHTKFPFMNREQGFNIMMLGRMSYVKNIPLALSMFHELWKKDSRYKLHLVGNISDPELVYYVENFIMKTANPNIHYHGRIDNDKLPEFMKDMHYILSSSIFESQGMGILEAMCCGLKPVVFNFSGAVDTFPMQCLWIDFEQFEKAITCSYDSVFYHNWSVENYSIEKNIYFYRNLIHGVLNGKQW